MPMKNRKGNGGRNRMKKNKRYSIRDDDGLSSVIARGLFKITCFVWLAFLLICSLSEQCYPSIPNWLASQLVGQLLDKIPLSAP
jgi:hypothetical protein